MHFCGDNLTKFSVYASMDNDLSCCSKEDGCGKHQVKKMSCCEDKSIFLYSDVNTLVDSYKVVDFSETVVLAELKIQESTQIKPFDYVQANAPPIMQGKSIYEVNSSYTFYG